MYTIDDEHGADGWQSWSCQGTSGGNYSFLFNITADPYEQTDLYDENPEIVAALTAKIDAYADAMMTTAYEVTDLDTATKEWAKTGNGTYVAPWKNVNGYKLR